jgi:hypothetical protein
MPLNNINEDVIFVVGHTPNTSTTYSGLTFQVHDCSLNLNPDLDWAKNLGLDLFKAKKSVRVGWPTNPDFLPGTNLLFYLGHKHHWGISTTH